jgi:glycosyltransferase involved in cell wall biosynthesis/SAM-dependent methyltransferase
MRILAISHGLYPLDGAGGVELFTAEVATLLSAEHKVRLLLFTSNDSSGQRAIPTEEPPLVQVTRIPDPSAASPRHRFGKEEFRSLLQDAEPDLIYIISAYRMPFEIMDVPADLGIPWILHLHDFWLLCPRIKLLNSNKRVCPGPRQLRCTKCLGQWSHPGSFVRAFSQYGDRQSGARRIVTGAAAVFCASTDLAKRHRKLGLARHQIIRVSPICRRETTMSPPLPAGGDESRIGFMGGESSSKGLAVLGEALACVQRPWKLQIHNVRKDRSKQKILQMFKGHADRVTIHGPFKPDQRDAIFSGLDVLVVPSIWPETYSRVVDEALERRVIVIASNLGGVAERLVDGVNGFLAEAGNPESFAQKIQYAIDHRADLRQTLRFDFLLPRTDEGVQRVLATCSALGEGRFKNGFLFDHEDEIRCIMAVTEASRENVERRLQKELDDPGCTVNEAWLAAGSPADDAAIDAFYRTTDAYLYDLIVAHRTREREQWRAIALSAMRRLGCHSVVDYGGGIGRDAAFFAKAGCEVTHYDVNGYLRRFAEYTSERQGNPIRTTGDVLSLPEGSFDAVYCTEVLEHVPNPSKELQQMRRLLKPTGVLIATESFGEVGERFLTHLPRHAPYASRLGALASEVGLVLLEVVPVPSNQMYVFRRTA